MPFLTLLAGAEALFLVLNLIAWRRNYVWTREMHACNRDLAKALNLASQGRYAEAEVMLNAWRNRMEVARATLIWRVVDGRLREWPKWRRWLGL